MGSELVARLRKLLRRRRLRVMPKWEPCGLTNAMMEGKRMDMIHQTAARLQDCNLYIFDLDGTVYEETGQFDVYRDELAKRVSPDKTQKFLADLNQAFTGQHSLKLGSSYHLESGLIRQGQTVVDWAGQTVVENPTSNWIHVGDPWVIYRVAARHYGLSQEQVQAAFAATRTHMQSDDFPMQGLPGLLEAITALKQQGCHFVLMTNSPEPDSRDILSKLGLADAFDKAIFLAHKEFQARQHLAELRDLFNLPNHQMVSIGDNFRNEILPALAMGMKAIYIDRYQIPDRTTGPWEDSLVEVSHPRALAPLLQSIATIRSTKTRDRP
ncbi:HAD family hydrolase [Alicyclobacillaceae bacterium I2511]|nr:HAD family hydrolase [Alicyclobacillaceae bacterium I2511]